jgi:hypothetical protein
VPSSFSFYHPKTDKGEIINNGCSQIPNTVRYQLKDADYRVELFSHGVRWKLAVGHNSEVRWADNNLNILIDGKKHSAKVKSLEKPYQRTYCDLLFWGCKEYDIYSEIINFPLTEATKVNVESPVPIVAGQKIDVSAIEYVYKKSVLWTAINC